MLSEEVLQLLADDAADRADEAARERSAVSAGLQRMDAAARRLLLAVHTPGDTVARIASETGAEARRLYRRLDTLRTQLRQCVQARLAREGTSA